MPKVTFTVKATNLAAYWLAIDTKDIRLVNGVGSIMLDAGPHIAVWYMEGSGGGSLDISGTLSNATKVLDIKGSTIPQRKLQYADNQSFIVAPQS